MELTQKHPRHLLPILTLLSLFLLTACGEGGNGSDTAPVISEASIIDDNGGVTVVGDTLTGRYIYTDKENDAEGQSGYRWLRNGNAISGATAINYTLVPADMGQNISLEITPVAATGKTDTGTAVITRTISIDNGPVAINVTIIDNNADIALVGDSLTANYTYNDTENDEEGLTNIQWLRNSTPITGETSRTYTLTVADVGNSVNVAITPRAETGTLTGVTVTSNGITALNTAPVASLATITDNGTNNIVIVGNQLTGNYQYADRENDQEGASLYRWFRSTESTTEPEVIRGATARTYIVRLADSGQTITFEVIPVAQTGTETGSAITSTTSVNIDNGPTVSNVTLADSNGGKALAGDQLTTDYSYADAENHPEGTSTFRWLRDGEVISGATAESYTLESADTGKILTVEVTPIATAGTLIGSLAISPVGIKTDSAPTANSLVIANTTTTITNATSAILNDSLTASYIFADIDNDPQGLSTYRWLRDGNPIAGATALTYDVVLADVSTQLSFEVTPIAAAGATAGEPETTSIVIMNSPPTVSNVTLVDDNGNNADEGDILVGDYTYSDVESDLQGASTFRWLRNGMPIDGATEINYTLTADDIPTRITFEVTPVAATGGLVGSAMESEAMATGSAPMVKGFARYLDINTNAINDLGDQIIIPFDQDVIVNASSISDFALSVTGDSFGTNARIEAGPESHEVTIVLGSGSILKTTGNFATDTTVASSPSGIDLSASIAAEAIESLSGIDAVQSTAIDLIPGFVAGDMYQLDDQSTFALGDVTGDGALDFVLNGFVYINNGEGRFTDSGQSFKVTPEFNLGYLDGIPWLGNMDGDGDLDLVITSLERNSFLYRNDGVGGFSQLGAVSGNRERIVALGDVNGDNDNALDLVISSFNSSLNGAGTRVSLNDGASVFMDTDKIGGFSNFAHTAVLGDLDNDLDLDLILLDGSGRHTRILLNNGDPYYAESSQTLGDSRGSRSVALAHVNSDGFLDIVLTRSVNTRTVGETAMVYFNDGTGNFTLSDQILAEDSWGVALADIDGDGDQDMVMTNHRFPGTGTPVDTRNRIYLNDGTGNFTESGQYLENDGISVAMGDLDADGDVDILMGNINQDKLEVRVYLNSHIGTD